MKILNIIAQVNAPSLTPADFDGKKYIESENSQGDFSDFLNLGHSGDPELESLEFELLDQKIGKTERFSPEAEISTSIESGKIESQLSEVPAEVPAKIDRVLGPDHTHGISNLDDEREDRFSVRLQDIALQPEGELKPLSFVDVRMVNFDHIEKTTTQQSSEPAVVDNIQSKLDLDPTVNKTTQTENPKVLQKEIGSNEEGAPTQWPLNEVPKNSGDRIDHAKGLEAGKLLEKYVHEFLQVEQATVLAQNPTETSVEPGLHSSTSKLQPIFYENVSADLAETAVKRLAPKLDYSPLSETALPKEDKEFLRLEAIPRPPQDIFHKSKSLHTLPIDAMPRVQGHGVADLQPQRDPNTILPLSVEGKVVPLPEGLGLQENDSPLARRATSVSEKPVEVSSKNQVVGDVGERVRFSDSENSPKNAVVFDTAEKRMFEPDIALEQKPRSLNAPLIAEKINVSKLEKVSSTQAPVLEIPNIVEGSIESEVFESDSLSVKQKETLPNARPLHSNPSVFVAPNAPVKMMREEAQSDAKNSNSNPSQPDAETRWKIKNASPTKQIPPRSNAGVIESHVSPLAGVGENDFTHPALQDVVDVQIYAKSSLSRTREVSITNDLPLPQKAEHTDLLLHPKKKEKPSTIGNNKLGFIDGPTVSSSANRSPIPWELTVKTPPTDLNSKVSTKENNVHQIAPKDQKGYVNFEEAPNKIFGYEHSFGRKNKNYLFNERFDDEFLKKADSNAAKKASVFPMENQVDSPPEIGVETQRAINSEGPLKSETQSSVLLGSKGGELEVPRNLEEVTSSYFGHINGSSNVENDVFVNKSEILAATKIAQQLVSAISPLPEGTIEISMRPEELGRVRMNLSIADGILTVSVIAERPETTELMRRHVETLSQEFRALGYMNVSLDFGSKQRDEWSSWNASNVVSGTEEIEQDLEAEEISTNISAEGQIDIRL